MEYKQARVRHFQERQSLRGHCLVDCSEMSLEEVIPGLKFPGLVFVISALMYICNHDIQFLEASTHGHIAHLQVRLYNPFILILCPSLNFLL